MINLHQNN